MSFRRRLRGLVLRRRLALLGKEGLVDEHYRYAVSDRIAAPAALAAKDALVWLDGLTTSRADQQGQ
jgi:hypothetical protein